MVQSYLRPHPVPDRKRSEFPGKGTFLGVRGLTMCPNCHRATRDVAHIVIPGSPGRHDEVGLVRDVLIQDSRSDELSTAAIDALEQWRFEPAVMDGEAVAVRYIVTLKFKLQ